MKKMIYTILFSFFAPAFLPACSCGYFSSFCEGVGLDSKVVVAQILNKYGNGDLFMQYMDVEVEEVLLGEVTSEVLTIVNYGTSCDLFHDGFEIGDRLILNGVDETRIDDFSGNPSLSPGGCGTSLLTLKNNTVTGFIKMDLNAQPFDDFKNEIGNCGNFINGEQVLENLYIFPNPTTQSINLYSDILIDEGLSFQLYTAAGQLVQEGNSSLPFPNGINVEAYPVGVYFLKIQIGDAVRTERIIKE